MTPTVTKCPEEGNPKNSTHGPFSRSQFQPSILLTLCLKKNLICQFLGPCKSILWWGLSSFQSEWASSSLWRILVERAWTKAEPVRRWWDDTGKILTQEQYAGAFKGKQEQPVIQQPTPREYLEKNRIQKGTYIESCTASPVTAAKTCRQSVHREWTHRQTAV